MAFPRRLRIFFKPLKVNCAGIASACPFQYLSPFSPFNAVNGIRENTDEDFKPRRIWSGGDVLLAGDLLGKGEKKAAGDPLKVVFRTPKSTAKLQIAAVSPAKYPLFSF